MSRLAGDMKGFVVLGVYRSTVKKQNKEKNTAMDFSLICTYPNLVQSLRMGGTIAAPKGVGLSGCSPAYPAKLKKKPQILYTL